MVDRRCVGLAGDCPNPGKLYPRGAFCDDCRPWGPPKISDPSRTLAALQTASGWRGGQGLSTVVDDQAVLSGKRRSAAVTFKDARARRDDALLRADARQARLDWSAKNGPCLVFLYVGGPLL